MQHIYVSLFQTAACLAPANNAFFVIDAQITMIIDNVADRKI